MRTLLLALPVVVACDEAGGFDYQPPGADTADDTSAGTDSADPGGDTADTADSADPGTTPDLPPSFEHCGPWLVPETLPGTVTVGEARFDIQGRQTLTWDGCHVVRQFDAKGRFRCETSWTVAATGSTQRESPVLVFDAVLTADPDHTTCPAPGKDTQGGFGIDLPRDFRDPKVTLYTSSADAWVDRGAYPVDISQAGVKLAYGFEVVPE